MNVVFGGNNGASPGGNASWAVNSVLDNGTVLFDTREALLPADTNDFDDVYRYRQGAYSLISSGIYQGTAHFIDASPDGTDIYFRTPESLLRADGDHEHASIYDARIDGGFPEPPPPPTPCDEEACRASRAAPAVFAEPGTVTSSLPPGKKRCGHRARKRQGRSCHRNGMHRKARGHDRSKSR
jgi:hypothetical protein